MEQICVAAQFASQIRSLQRDGGVYNWLQLIKSESMEEIHMLKNRSEAIGKAVNVLEYLSQDEQARELYESREKGLKDYNSAINSATREGEKRGASDKAIEIAKKLLSRGDSVEEIKMMTGLTEQEIKDL